MSKYIGCYKDSSDRDLPKYKGKHSFEKCEREAQKHHKSYFGLQQYLGDKNEVECWTGDSYGNAGESTNCKQDGEHTYGKDWTNAVYKTKEGYDGADQFTYKEFKGRMQEWCSSLKEQGIYDETEYQDCLKMYQNIQTEMSDGESNMLGTDKIKYQYGFDQNPTYNDNPVSTVTKDDYQKVYFLNESGRFLMADQDGNIRVTKDPKVDRNREWQLVNLGKEIFAIRSTYGKYISITPDHIVKADRTDLSPWVQFKLEKRGNQHSFQSISHKVYLTSQEGDIGISTSWTQFSLWNVEIKNAGGVDRYIELFSLDQLQLEKNNILSRMENQYGNYLQKGLEVAYAEHYIVQIMNLRDRQLTYILNKLTGLTNYMNNKLTKEKENNTSLSEKLVHHLMTMINQLYELAKENHFNDQSGLGAFGSQGGQTQTSEKQLDRMRRSIYYVFKSNMDNIPIVAKYIKDQIKILRKERKISIVIDGLIPKIYGYKQTIKDKESSDQKIIQLKKHLSIIDRHGPKVREAVSRIQQKEATEFNKLKVEIIRDRYMALDKFKESEKELEKWTINLKDHTGRIIKEIKVKLENLNRQIGKINNLTINNMELEKQEDMRKHMEYKGDVNLELIELQSSRYRQNYWGSIIIGLISICLIIIICYKVSTRLNINYA